MSAKTNPVERRRAAIARLKASLNVPQYTSIKTAQASKQQPASRRFATI